MSANSLRKLRIYRVVGIFRASDETRISSFLSLSPPLSFSFSFSLSFSPFVTLCRLTKTQKKRERGNAYFQNEKEFLSASICR